MARTLIGVGDPKAVKKYSGMLAVDVARDAYWTSTMVGTGPTTQLPIQRITDLEKGAGDLITYDLSLQLRGQPTIAGETLEGNEEDLRFATDQLYIDQMRKAVSAGDKMTQKRTLIDLRMVAKARLTEWWTRIYDEIFFVYMSGARGINTDYILNPSFQGFAGNPMIAPDPLHHMYGGVATSYATLATTDVMSLAVVDKLKVRSTMMGGGVQGTPQIQPIKIDGGDYFVLLMSPHQEYAMRTNTNVGQWLDIQKALTLSMGKENPIFKGGLGMYNDVILKSHKSVVRFNDAGAGANVNAARALFLGRQAAVVAFGSAGQGMSFDWIEKAMDYDDVLNVASASIFGIKKCSYNIAGTSYDFGLIAVDTAIDATLG